MTGRIHSIQTLGTLDGPGVRFVLFMQGCPLRCAYCHNPDTWDPAGGQIITAEEALQKALRYKNYFGKDGGVTVTGGEALLQADFVRAFFALCHANGLHTALDTSGCIWNEAVAALLVETDLCLLDIKMTNEADYRRYTGASLEKVMAFLAQLQARSIPTWVRQVIVPTINDTEENIEQLNEWIAPYPCIERVELLAFHKLCVGKYEALGQPFPFGHLEAAKPEQVAALQEKVRLPRREDAQAMGPHF